MDANDQTPLKPWSAITSRWYGTFGVFLTGCSLFAVLCLIAFDLLGGFSVPYMGILTYMVAPMFIWIGLVLTAIAFWRGRRKRKVMAVLDFNVPRQRRNFILACMAAFFFLLLSAFGSFQAHQATETTYFCGVLCHSVMKPEYVAYQNSPHARVLCVECHIGAGAKWLVRSKISGLHQVYAIMANSYSRPIPTPVQNLRPSRGTCEQCHWPEKFLGTVDLPREHFLPGREENPWTIRLLVKVGGGRPSHGLVGGIHWHMAVANRIEYIPADETRQTISWVRLTDLQTGKVTIYESETPLPQGQPKQEMRRLDCIDCHNRPTHIFASPNEALDLSLHLGRISPAMPDIKVNTAGALVLGGGAENEAQGLDRIADKLSRDYKEYPDQDAVRQAIVETQHIFKNNFFPEMRTSWKVRPNNIGHQIWPGCFRCHGGRHKGQGGEKISRDCNACHTIIAQGQAPVAKNLDGLTFDHPGGQIPTGMLCNECHTGTP